MRSVVFQLKAPEMKERKMLIYSARNCQLTINIDTGNDQTLQFTITLPIPDFYLGSAIVVDLEPGISVCLTNAQNLLLERSYLNAYQTQ